MIKSMTGYGKAVFPFGNGKITAEIRSVNHRYGEIFVKLPRALMQWENDVRKCVGERLKRGKIEVFIQLEETAGVGVRPVPNIALARAYYDSLTALKDELGLNDPVTLPLIASQKDVLVTGEGASETESLQADIIAAVREAVDNLDAMRLREGAVLLEDVRKRRDLLSSLIGAVAQRAPQAVAECAARLKERVSLLAAESGVDEGRLAQEIAILADRCDITEELVRFNSHLCQFDEALCLSEPVGRKLDFLMQELNREVNTIGSKANDGEIAAQVVELKAELEKIREQVQNIE